MFIKFLLEKVSFCLSSVSVFGTSHSGLCGESFRRVEGDRGGGGGRKARSDFQSLPGGRQEWRDDHAGSDLLYGLSGDQASLLSAAQPQEHLAVFPLSNADLKGIH